MENIKEEQMKLLLKNYSALPYSKKTDLKFQRWVADYLGEVLGIEAPQFKSLRYLSMPAFDILCRAAGEYLEDRGCDPTYMRMLYDTFAWSVDSEKIGAKPPREVEERYIRMLLNPVRRRTYRLEDV